MPEYTDDDLDYVADVIGVLTGTLAPVAAVLPDDVLQRAVDEYDRLLGEPREYLGARDIQDVRDARELTAATRLYLASIRSIADRKAREL